jgi:cell division protein FtsI/penicillin-binding protein 2
MNRPRITPLDIECDRCLTKRATMALFLAVLGFSALSGRIFYLQMVQYKVWTAKADKNRVREDILPAPRGPILDTKLRLLTSDEAMQSVVFDNMSMREFGAPDKETGRAKSLGAMDRMAQALAKSEDRPWTELRRTWDEKEMQQRFLWWMASLVAPALERTPEEIAKMITDRKEKGEPRRWDSGETTLAAEINAQQANRLNQIMQDNKLGCLRIKSFFRRTQLNDPEFLPLIGSVQKSRDGDQQRGPRTGGIELARDADLTGVDGKRTYEVDVGGREISSVQNQIIDPQEGKALRLTLDMTLKEIVAASMSQTGNDPKEVYLPSLKPARVMVVLMDAKTMAIRAMVSWDKDQLPCNAAATGVYEPGSTMKICTMAAALDSGKVNLNTYIAINGPTYNDADVERITDDESFPSLSVRDILVHSSNIGAYKLARTVGMKKFEDMIYSFGFGKRTNFMGMVDPLKQAGLETRGLVAKEWTYNVLARTSFGYNISVTPIQMCSALGVILNDGWYREPYMVEAVMDSRNRVLEEHKPKNIRRVVSSNAAKGTREAMLEVVERGTGSKAQSRDYYIAGKTGTALLNRPKDEGGGYYKDRYVVSFLGFAPVVNPKLIGVVVIDDPRAPKEQLYGGKLAAPVFRRIMDAALRYYEVPGEAVTHVAKPRRS